MLWGGFDFGHFLKVSLVSHLPGMGQAHVTIGGVTGFTRLHSASFHLGLLKFLQFFGYRKL